MNAEKRRKIFAALQAENPAPTTELNYQSTFELLIAVMLSAQATDVGVNKATARLFLKARTPETLLALGETQLAEMISSINYYRTKAKNILRTCQLLVEHFNSQVPLDFTALISLPGVGRKTANVILNTAYGAPTIAVDTHIFRVANRTGLAKGKNVIEVEEGLLRTTPKEYIPNAHHWLILHGRYVCTARKPKCPQCVINSYCEYEHKT